MILNDFVWEQEETVINVYDTRRNKIAISLLEFEYKYEEDIGQRDSCIVIESCI